MSEQSQSFSNQPASESDILNDDDSLEFFFNDNSNAISQQEQEQAEVESVESVESEDAVESTAESNESELDDNETSSEYNPESSENDEEFEELEDNNSENHISVAPEDLISIPSQHEDQNPQINYGNVTELECDAFLLSYDFSFLDGPQYNEKSFSDIVNMNNNVIPEGQHIGLQAETGTESSDNDNIFTDHDVIDSSISPEEYNLAASLSGFIYPSNGQESQVQKPMEISEPVIFSPQQQAQTVETSRKRKSSEPQTNPKVKISKSEVQLKLVKIISRGKFPFPKLVPNEQKLQLNSVKSPLFTISHNKKFGLNYYEPIMYKTDIDPVNGKEKLSGLCPYCDDQTFHPMGNEANYKKHMQNIHGIYNSANETPEHAHNHCEYEYTKFLKNGPKQTRAEFVECGTCSEIVQLGTVGVKGARHRLLAYYRHCTSHFNNFKETDDNRKVLAKRVPRHRPAIEVEVEDD